MNTKKKARIKKYKISVVIGAMKDTFSQHYLSL